MYMYMHIYMDLILSSKRPWALEIDRPKNGGGRLHRQAIFDVYKYVREP